MTDIAALKAAALAATPGTRKFEPHPYGYGYSVLWVPETRAEILVTGGRNDGDDPITWMGEELTDGDRDFIEAANPAAILALIARPEAAEARVAGAATKSCPFNDPTYTIPVDQPCPVCGDIGRMTDEPSKCIDDVGAAPCPPLRARLAAAAPALDDATLDALERAALPLVWVSVGQDDWELHLGGTTVGVIFLFTDEDWAARGRVITDHRSSAKSEAAARAALVAAVMEAIYG